MPTKLEFRLLAQVEQLQNENERLQHHCGKRMNAMEAENKAQSAEIAQLRMRVQEMEQAQGIKQG